MSTLRATTLVNTSGNDFKSWELLETQVASGDATIEVTGLSSTYFSYRFLWQAIKSSSDAQFALQTSTNGGSSYDAGASDYAYSYTVVTSVTASFDALGGTDSTDRLRLLATSEGSTSDTSVLIITLLNHSISEYTKFNWTAVQRESIAGSFYYVTGAGARLSAATVNAVRFLYSAGNISGTLKVYGLKA